MKLEEDLKAVRYIRERVDLVVNEKGQVILPAWQFALFVREYENHRFSNIMWVTLFLLLAVWLVIYTIILR